MSDVTDPLPIRRRELDEILAHLESRPTSSLLLLGGPGSGKTTMLHMLQEELRLRRRDAFYANLHQVRRPGEVGNRVLDAVGVLDSSRTLQSSAGAPPMSEVIEALRVAGARLSSPVLLLDGLDEALDLSGTTSVIEELIGGLTGWRIVIGTRPPVIGGLRSRSPVTELTALSREETAALLRRLLSNVTDQDVSDAYAVTGGLPLAVWFVAASGRLEVPSDWKVGSGRDLIERTVDAAIRDSSDSTKVLELLERLALTDIGELVAALAARSGIKDEEVVRLLSAERVGVVIRRDVPAGTVRLVHTMVKDIILARRLRRQPFRLADLVFGAEEAERDDLLDESFVPRQNVTSILGQQRSIVVGDRGSGKSAIFRKLSATTEDVFPVANAGDHLYKIAGVEAAHNADTLRAAWLVVFAAVVSAAMPESAPKKLRREAAELRTAVSLPTKPVGGMAKALRAAARPFGGTTLRFAVGPVNLEAELPIGGAPQAAGTVDVESFLQELDGLLRDQGRRAIVLFDRIDELLKYDRLRQEAFVQGLLQVESRISQFDSIDLVVFLRTDLFELYDIQEKNKLVSRRLVLEWSEEDWLQVLVRRVLTNKPLEWAADRLRLTDGGFETRPALNVLFPAELEGRPIDRWLVDSVRNGNGDVSPRLAVLLLHLARDYSTRQQETVGALPLFSADAVTRAMTEVSELSFSEVVNDFKVAPSFVLNCRAGKLDTFGLSEVKTLFEESDGPVSEQVRLLERLGFLERVVRETDSGAESLFRIPRLYTRCWSHH